MDNKENEAKKPSEVLDNLKYHTGAVDVKIVALTGLLLDKGFITVKEIEQSYVDVIEAVKNHSENNGQRNEEFESYLTEFLQINKPYKE